VFSAHAGLELYAEAFEAAGALERLEGFAAVHGADFYGLPHNAGTVTLLREPWEVPDRYPFGADELVPLRAGERIAWRLAPPASRPTA
jgi:dihydroorotase